MTAGSGGVLGMGLGATWGDGGLTLALPALWKVWDVVDSEDARRGCPAGVFRGGVW